MFKKMFAAVLAVTLCAAMLGGCAGKEKKDSSSGSNSSETADANTSGSAEETVEVPEPSLTIDGKEVDTDGYIMCNIGGYDVSFDEFRFYYYYTLDLYQRNYGMTMDNIAQTEESYKDFLNAVVVCIKQEIVTQKLAEENDIALDDEDMNSVQSNITAAKGNYENEEAYAQGLKQSYLTEELYELMMERAQLYNKVMTTLFANEGKYATKYDDMKAIISDTEQYAREIHVMIPAYSQAQLDDSTAAEFDSKTLSQKIGAKQEAYAALDEAGQQECKDKALELAKDICEKANNGEDFTQLIEENGWDLGLEDPSTGYYVYKENTNGFPQALLNEIFSLEPGQVSQEPVDVGDYGYFVVKRLEPDQDYVDLHIAELTNSYDEPKANEILAEKLEELEVTYCDDWEKLTAGSIT